MIQQRDDLFKRIKFHSFTNRNLGWDYDEKLDLFEHVLDNSVQKICKTIADLKKELHLGYSGGVDSSLVLVKMLKYSAGKPVIAHTMGARPDFPDIVHASKFAESLKEQNSNLVHKVHIVNYFEEDTQESNRLLGTNEGYPSNYYLLMKTVAPETRNMICCDCIDELMGGYYSHQDPSKLPVYDSKKSMEDNRIAALEFFMSKLIPNHLSILDTLSSHFNVEIFMPYASKRVMECAEHFAVSELVDSKSRKKPVYAIAERNGVSRDILERRKYGLCSAMDLERKS